MNSMRVLVVDDHPLFRDGIASLLEAAGFEIAGQAGTGQEAIEAVQRLEPDLVLMDITMPGMSGLEALRAIKSESPETQVVMLTVSEEDEDLIQAIQAGASGYLLKNLDAGQFVEMLQGLQAGEAAITRKTAARLIARFAELAHPRVSSPIELTERETQLLELVATGLSNKAIAQRLGLSENTVKYHMRNVLQKFNAQNRTEAVTQAIQLGLIKPPPLP